MRKGIWAVILSCFLALPAARAVSHSTHSPRDLDITSVDLPDIAFDVEGTLPVRAKLEPAKQPSAARVRYSFPLIRLYPSSYLTSSKGIPAKVGQDLLTFIHLWTT